MAQQFEHTRPLAQVLTPIDRALNDGDTGLAVRLARQELDAGYVHPLLLHLRAVSKKENGMAESALADLQRALRLAPRSP